MTGHRRHEGEAVERRLVVSNEDAEYYSQRAQAEHELAQKATRPEVVSAHYQLAEAYLEKAAEAEQTEVTNEKSSRDC